MQSKQNVNVGERERWVSGIAGASLVLGGLQGRQLLNRALILGGIALINRGVTGKCGVYRKLGINSAEGGHRLAIPGGLLNGTVKVQKTVTIKAEPQEVYKFWRNFENLPRFTENLFSVSETQPGLTHWRARGAGDLELEWDARIVEDTPGERISWTTVEESPVQHNGSVRFTVAPGGRGTEVKVVLRYEIPAGRLGQLVAKMLGEEPGQQLDADLRRLKMFLETGEVARTDGQPAGAGRDTTGQRSTNDALLDLSIR
jgi:uncharacterized membrane protein